MGWRAHGELGMDRKALFPCTPRRGGGSLMPRWAHTAPGQADPPKPRPLLWPCLPEPGSHLRLSTCHPAGPCPSAKKSNGNKGEKCTQLLPVLAAEFLSWRILELFTFFTLLR